LKTTILACTVAAAMGGLFAYQDSAAPTEREPVAMERASMDGWLKGDSAPTLSAADPDITLFHVMTQHRLDGVAAVKALYEPYAGRPLFESYQIENPKVQTAGDVAILSYQLATQNGGTTRRWNATEVYQKKKAGWRVIHSHFSTTAGTPQ
jgi:ketosteroid isomerase-like protein